MAPFPRRRRRLLGLHPRPSACETRRRKSAGGCRFAGWSFVVPWVGHWGQLHASDEGERAVKYMLLIYVNSQQWEEKVGPAGQAAEMQEYFAYTADLQRRGVLVAGEPLAPPTSATTVQVQDGGGRLVTDGPFAESKEWLAGYYIV